MQNKIEMIKLLQDKEILEEEYSKLIFGSIEIRRRNGYEYIYVHNRIPKDNAKQKEKKKDEQQNGQQNAKQNTKQDTKQNTKQNTKQDEKQDTKQDEKQKEKVHISKYVGEYSDKLYNLIVSNNIKAKEIKRELRKINNQLKQMDYIEEELSPKVEQNIDFVKKHLLEIIYKQSQLEDIFTTMLNIKNILNGGKVSRMMSDEILKIINIKRAWDFILNKNVILGKTDYDLLCQINKILEEGLYYTAGKIRNIPIESMEENKQLNIPTEKDIKENIEKILNKNLTDVEKAIEMFLYILKENIFIDGNKSTALIFVNQYLISRGKGIISVPTNEVKEFNELLSNYYNNKDIIKTKIFIKERCYIQV